MLSYFDRSVKDYLLPLDGYGNNLERGKIIALLQESIYYVVIFQHVMFLVNTPI